MRRFRIAVLLVALAALGAGLAAAPPPEHDSAKRMATLWRLYPLKPQGAKQGAVTRRPRPIVRPTTRRPWPQRAPIGHGGGTSATLVAALLALGVAVAAVAAAFLVRVRRRRARADVVPTAPASEERLDEALRAVIPRPRAVHPPAAEQDGESPTGPPSLGAAPAAKLRSSAAPKARPPKAAKPKPKPSSRPAKPPHGSKPSEPKAARKLDLPPGKKPDLSPSGKAKPALKKEQTGGRPSGAGSSTRTATRERNDSE
jgi:hypothetical protein